MAIDFNPEDKITYEDLSKSSRTIIDSMKKYLSEDQKKDISSIRTRIEELDKRAEKLKKNGGVQESIWTGDMKESSSKGQVLKVRCPTYKIDKSSKTKNVINTTQFTIKGDDTYFNPDYTMEFSCPDTKPADWPQEMYNNIKEMMTKPNHVGFGCRSGQPRFTIVDQSGIFDDTDIYALHQNKQYYFNYFTNKWEVKQKITDNKDISPKTFLYNKNLNNLVFLDRETDAQPFTWSKLELNKMPAYKKIKF